MSVQNEIEPIGDVDGESELEKVQCPNCGYLVTIPEGGKFVACDPTDTDLSETDLLRKEYNETHHP